MLLANIIRLDQVKKSLTMKIFINLKNIIFLKSVPEWGGGHLGGKLFYPYNPKSGDNGHKRIYWKSFVRSCSCL